MNNATTVLGQALLLCCALLCGACVAAPGPSAEAPTLGPGARTLAESFDPVAIVARLPTGAGCSGVTVEQDLDRSYADLAWQITCPRGRGDRTVYFQLVDAIEAWFASHGAAHGSGSGMMEDDLLFDGFSFSLAGTRGHVRTISNDLDEQRLRITVTLDAIATE
jgi:hypothetical protein